MTTETAASAADLAELISRINSDLYADTAKHDPPIHKLRLWRSRVKTKAADDFTIREGAPDQPKSVDDLNQRIDELEQEGHTLRVKVKRLQEAGKTVIAQREQWKARALAAEEHLETERTRRSKGADRFDALRRLVAKELHPDFCTGGDLEKLMRQECFKKLWPEIDRLAEREQ
jgi:hypothetical protein